MDRPRLHFNFITELDWLIALEFGRVDDAQPPENWREVSEQFGFLCENFGGRELGSEMLASLPVEAPKATWRDRSYISSVVFASHTSKRET